MFLRFFLTMTRRTWPNTKSYSEIFIKYSPYDGHTHFNFLLSARFRCQFVLRKHVTSSSGSKVCTLQATSMVHITFTCSCNIFNTVRCKLRFTKSKPTEETHRPTQNKTTCIMVRVFSLVAELEQLGMPRSEHR